MKRWCDECKFKVQSCEHKLVVSPEASVVLAVRNATEEDLGRIPFLAGRVLYDSDWAFFLESCRQEKAKKDKKASDDNDKRLAWKARLNARYGKAAMVSPDPKSSGFSDEELLRMVRMWS